MRIGSRNAQILDLIHASGDAGMSVGDIEQVLGIRRDNLKSRNIPELMEYELIVEGEDGRYYTPEDVVEALEIHLEASKCNRSAEKQKQRHQEEREEDAQKRRGKGTDSVTGEESNDSSHHRVNQTNGAPSPVQSLRGQDMTCQCKAVSMITSRYYQVRQHVSGDVTKWRTHTSTPIRKMSRRG